MDFVNRYAGSFWSVVKRKSVEEQVYQDVLRWRNVCSENPALVTFLQRPVVRLNRKGRLLGRLTATFHQLTQDFFLLVNRRKRIDCLLPILEAFIARYKTAKSIQVARIVSASSVAPKNRKKLLDFVQRLTGAHKVDLTIDIDPSLIGGYVLYVDGKRLDASLRSGLNQLAYRWGKTV